MEGPSLEYVSFVIQVAGERRQGRTFALVFRHLDVRVESPFLVFWCRRCRGYVVVVGE